MQTTSISTAADRLSLGGRSVRSRFYVGLAAFMCGIVLVGFWPTYFGPAFRGQIARPLVIQLHGLIFVGWMVLLMAQVLLASRGQVRAHRKLGAWGIAYGSAVLVMGVIAGVAAPVMHLSSGEWTRDRAAGFLLITLGDMVLFGSLFAAAIVYRRRPEIHKRLMIAATVALLFAAVGRMSFIQSQLDSRGGLALADVCRDGVRLEDSRTYPSGQRHRHGVALRRRPSRGVRRIGGVAPSRAGNPQRADVMNPATRLYSRRRSLPFRFVRFAQPELLDLSGRRHRKRLHEAHVARHFEPRQPGFTERDQIHSGTLVAHTATRSPGFTPLATRPRAMRQASSFSERKVQRVSGWVVDERVTIRQRLGQPREECTDRDIPD